MITTITNATIVNEGRRFFGAIVIKDDRIAEIIEGNYTPSSSDHVVDAAGCFVLPGVIDDHVHFREPGLTHKADIESESRAAAYGGVTTIIDFLDPTRNARKLERSFYDRLSFSISCIFPAQKSIAIRADSSSVSSVTFVSMTLYTRSHILRTDGRCVVTIQVLLG